MNTTHIDVVGYALNAVDDLERVRYERHLRECSECREEVAEMNEVTAMLALDAPEVTPSAALRVNLLEQIQNVPQDAPQDIRATHSAQASRSGRGRRALIGLVAAAAIVVGGASVAKVAPWSNSSSSTTNAAARIAKAPDAVRKTAPFRGGTITVVMSRSMNQAVATLDKVAAAGDKTTYQGWYIKSDGPTSAGVLMPSGQSVLASKLSGASEFDITIEPAGGSAVPTNPPILAIPMA
ncbi:MAG: anti-sigma factor [Actinomycetota bacterium]|nr:anti-sigma factor [Actinomycetota bacterium]